jgi:hypothetical protein
MPTVQEHESLIKGIDRLLVEEGENAGQWRAVTKSAKDLLLAGGLPNTENHWNYILHVMKTTYPDSTWERGSRDEGWVVRVRIRTK